MSPNLELIHAYRRLLRAGLRAVQFSQPSRSTLTERLREGFRDPKGVLDAERVRRTVWFLNAAAQQRGLEHKILKNLCRVHWDRMREARRTPWKMRLKKEQEQEQQRAKGKAKDPDVISGTEYEHYERTIAMLNDTMGLCLR
ncbi:uncharacterized protein B0T15DRAFT_233315 [Chaetomium strumarium]|uniref:Uncharacterized protein n=1 Tax=Chaetomium strumarium TaxID=1170767 RepID=A0AAJ0GQH5_9PEZI|nr:hypothetical protein B0T15DRAFT_233315 [Chaetomium strumarium]